MEGGLGQMIPMAMLLVGMAGAVLARPSQQPATSRKPPEAVSPLRAPIQGTTADELFSELLEHNQLRAAHLQQYSAIRTYEVRNQKGKVYAQEVVLVGYLAPDKKTFVTTFEEGSKLVRNLVLKRLIQSEAETSSGREHRDSSIRPANYSFNLLGEQDLGPYHCFVVEATPQRRDKYLFEGRVWIDAQDFAVVRIAGHPAKKLSFWINRADFVRQYQKVGEFWLPLKDQTIVDVRLYGTKILTIDHRNYRINGGEFTDERGQAAASDYQEIDPSNSSAPAGKRNVPKAASE